MKMLMSFQNEDSVASRFCHWFQSLHGSGFSFIPNYFQELLQPSQLCVVGLFYGAQSFWDDFVIINVAY